MFSKLRKIPLVENLQISQDSGVLLMTIEGTSARGYLCPLSLVLSIFIERYDYFSSETIRYITLLLAGCPDVHDHALQILPDGGWLCGYYDKNITPEIITAEIERHLSLTRYLTTLVSGQKNIFK